MHFRGNIVAARLNEKASSGNILAPARPHTHATAAPWRSLLLALGALAGAAGGIGAARLCDWLPPRYGVTQVATGAARVRRNTGVILIVIGVGVWLAHLTAAAPSTSLERAAFYFATNLGISLAVVAAAAIDLEHMILPNELTFGAAAIALATSYWRAVGLRGALLGAIVGLAVTCLPALLYKKLRRRSGAGVGDATLVAVAGLWFGAPGGIFVCSPVRCNPPCSLWLGYWPHPYKKLR